MLTRIHVNRHHIASNVKRGTNLPVFTAKNYKENRRGNRVEIKDKDGRVVATFVYGKPLPCGARAYVETELDVVVTGDMV